MSTPLHGLVLAGGEPEPRQMILVAVDAGRHYPREFIVATGVPLLDLPESSVLDNVNTPWEFAAAAARLAAVQGGRR